MSDRFEVKGYYKGLFGSEWSVWDNDADRFAIEPGLSQAEAEELVRVWNGAWQKKCDQEHAAELMGAFNAYLAS